MAAGSKPTGFKQANVVPRGAVGDDLGQDFSNHAAELEAMAAEARRHLHLREARMFPDYEIQIGRKRVEARCRFDEFAIKRGQELAHRAAHLGDVVFTDPAIHRLRCAWFRKRLPIKGDLYPTALAI